MKIYDLSYPIEAGMPTYPGDPATRRETLCRAERDGYNLSTLFMSPHSGTHLDAPRHFLPAGAGVDGLPLTCCVGMALHIRIPAQKGVIKVAELLDTIDAAKRPEEHILLLSTGHGKSWGSGDYYTDAPVFDRPLGEALASRGITALAIDAPSVTVSPDRIRDGHVDLLSREIAIIENIAAADGLAEHIFFSAAPIKLRDGDGAPVRAYAIETK